MTPSARIQTATQLLNQIFNAWNSEKRIPADKLLENYFKANRYIGSKDRGAIAELVYFVLRQKAGLGWWLERCRQPQDGRAYVLAALVLRGEYDIGGIKELTKEKPYGLLPLSEDEKTFIKKLEQHESAQQEMPAHARLNYPQWVEPLLKDSFADKLEAAMLAMAEQAPTDLRANTLKTSRAQLLKDLQAEGFECAPTRLSPIGIRLEKRAPVFNSRFFKQGHFEVQDEGSQAVALLVDAKPGQKVIDFCAGAGGKTLALAAEMENKGRILAWDISEKRLGQISQRLRRAGVHNVQSHILQSEHDPFIKRHKDSADRVLLDAPCSGSGTWRRNPDLKWRFTPQDLAEVTAVQQAILQSAARLVKKGGRLVYATCSIFKDENERQIEKFLHSQPGFRLLCAEKIWNKQPAETLATADAAYFSVAPHEDGVDGFFAAIMERV